MLNDTNDPYIHLASKVIMDLSEDTRLREMARTREKSIRDALSELANAKDEGFEIGIEQGRAEGRAEERQRMIDAMRTSGMNENDIQKLIDIIS